MKKQRGIRKEKDNSSPESMEVRTNSYAKSTDEINFPSHSLHAARPFPVLEVSRVFVVHREYRNCIRVCIVLCRVVRCIVVLFCVMLRMCVECRESSLVSEKRSTIPVVMSRSLALDDNEKEEDDEEQRRRGTW